MYDSYDLRVWFLMVSGLNIVCMLQYDITAVTRVAPCITEALSHLKLKHLRALAFREGGGTEYVGVVI